MPPYGGLAASPRPSRAAELKNGRGYRWRFAAVSIRKSDSEISAENPPTLHLRSRPALQRDGGLQHQAEAAAAGSAPEEALQAVGSNVAKGGPKSP